MKQNEVFSLKCNSKSEKLCGEQGGKFFQAFSQTNENWVDILGRAKGKLVMKKAMGFKSLVEVSIHHNEFRVCALDPFSFSVGFHPSFLTQLHIVFIAL